MYDARTGGEIDEMDAARDARQRAEDNGEPWPTRAIGDPFPPRQQQPIEGENHHAENS
jgi:hypothetical protein